jgi:D-arginine dehydrogenase
MSAATPPDPPFDVAIVGGGIAGAAAAYALAPRHRVLLLERESQCGYHTTGRSAALYIEIYGNETVRALTVAGRAFFHAPPAGFAEHPLLTPRGMMYVAGDAGRAAIEALHAEIRDLSDSARVLEAAEVRDRCPVLRPEVATCGLLDPEAMDIDVHALHQGYLRAARAQGMQLVTDAGVEALARADGLWTLRTRAGTFRAAHVVNAAGAWADDFARLAGAEPIGLAPLRRTAITFDAPAGSDPAGWHAVVDIDETWYFKPEAGRLMGSPADETPSPPCDAQPEELDVAVCVERIEQASTMTIRRLVSRWAGLRSFAPDRTLVIGPDPRVEGFFWCAGQGGYGMQTAPGTVLAIAGLFDDGELPPALRALGVTPEALSPARFASRPA